MELRQLRYFVALAQTETFSDAASRVHVSQPALSQQIKGLESELDTQLVERMGKKIKLTEDGRSFLPGAMKVLDALRAAESSVRETDSRLSGTLNLGIIPTISPYFLPDLVSHFHREAPDIRFHIEEQQTETLLQRLRIGAVDHLLLSPPIDDGGLETESLGSEPFYLAVDRDNSLSGRGSISIQQINDEPLLLLEQGHCLRDQSLSFCQQEEVEPHVVFQGSSLQSILNLVETGLGATIVPRMVLNQSPPENTVFLPFDDPKPSRDLILVRRNSMELTPLDHRLIEFCGEWFDYAA